MARRVRLKVGRKANSGSADDVCWCLCLSACGIEEFEMVLWLRGGGVGGKFLL